MQPFRFIHCGDLHLGAPFQYATGISRAVDRAVSEATDRKSTRLNSSHIQKSRMPSSA